MTVTPSSTPQQKNAIEIKNNTGTELNATQSAAAAQTKIQASMMMAVTRPRDERKFKSSLLEACGDEDFAEDALYAFPRGGATVEGLSVNIAREMARLWGNLHYGVDIVGEDETTRQVRGWAWDLESGAHVHLDDAFAKLVYRKSGGWIKADERDLRELNNRRAAILERNCILKLIPPQYKKAAERAVKEALKKFASAAPEKSRQSMVEAFAGLGVAVTELEKYLKHPINLTTPEEIAKMKGVYRSIVDGNSRWEEYLEPVATAETAAPSKATIDINAIKAGAEENRGHGEEGLEKLAQGTAESETAPEAGEAKGEAEKAPYEAPAKPKLALMDLATERNNNDREAAKAAVKRAAMDFFNKEIKTVNDLTAEEATRIHEAATRLTYEL